MVDSLDIQALQGERYRILGEIASLGDLRPGQLSRRFHRCGKPACHCQQEGDPGHGPYFVLHFSAKGRQTSRSIPKAQADTVRAQTEEYRRLCRLHRELIAVSERLCMARLAAAAAGEASGEDKKKRAAASSPRRSRLSWSGSLRSARSTAWISRRSRPSCATRRCGRRHGCWSGA